MPTIEWQGAPPEWRKTDPRGDRVEGEAGEERHPQHTAPTTPAKKNTDFVGGE